MLQAILKAHDAQTNRTMAVIGISRAVDGVVINVDDIIQHTHGRADGALRACLDPVPSCRFLLVYVRQQID